MLLQVHTPERLTAHQLDDYLGRGWFRMGQTIFTTNFIRNEEKIHSTIWLRLLLDDCHIAARHARLFKKNSRFSIQFRLAELTPEKEDLFFRYKQHLLFQASDSLHQLLFGQSERSLFTTYEVTLHDAGRLIACGFFDVGAKSAEGITSFYDPDYKPYSLGKFLICLKIMYCKDLGMKYFYPGYFVPGNPHFDYKLSIDKEALEFLSLTENSWKPISRHTAQDIPIDLMRQKLLRLQQVLADSKESRLLKYRFFDANFIPEMRDTGLLDFPLFLSCGNDEVISPILVFDVRDNQFHLLSCAPVWRPIAPNEVENYYSAYYLMPVGEIHATASEKEMAAKLSAIVVTDD